MNKKIRKSSPYVLIVVSVAAIVWIVVFFMQGAPEKHKYPSPFLNANSRWADSLIQSMTVDEKVGQLIYSKLTPQSYMVQLNVFQGDNKIKPGAVFLEADSMAQFYRIVRQMQSHTPIPYLIGTLSFSGIPTFKDFPTFSSTDAMHWQNSDSLAIMYVDYLTKFNELFNIDLTFPIHTTYLRNKSILNDSLNMEEALKIAGLINNKVQATKKLCGIQGYNYFPQSDSSESDKRNVYPYNKLGNLGVSAILIDSLNYKFNTKSFFSSKYNFNGLIIANIDSADFTVEALENHFANGGDAIISDYDFFRIHSKIKNLVANGKISEKSLNEKLRKTLLAKYYRGISDKGRVFVPFDSLKNNISLTEANLLDREIKESSIVLIKNGDATIPLQAIHRKKIHNISVGDEKLPEFNTSLNVYKNVSSDHFEEINNSFVDRFKKVCETNNTIILAINKNIIDSASISSLKWLVEKYSKENKLILVNYGNESNLAKLSFFPVIVHSFDYFEYSQAAVGQMIFGGIEIKGSLAFGIHDTLPFGYGIETEKKRFKYTIPEELGISSIDMAEIDKIANEAIRRGATPGCQVFVAKDGKVIHNKSYGFHTYSKVRKVKTSDLYDIASITKVVATTLQTMKMYDNKSISLNTKLSRFFRDRKIDYSNIKPDTIFSLDTLFFDEVTENQLKKIVKERDTINLSDSMFIAFDTLLIATTPKNNIFKIRIRDLLTHKSGLQPSMPILRFMLFKNDSVNNYSEYYTNSYNKDSASRKIANGVYLKNSYFDTLWKDTKRMKVYSKKRFNYSDANMVLLQMALDSLNRRSIRSYMQSNFYTPLGLKTTCYKPLYRFGKYRIVPTERDKWWRQQVLRGYVHDPTAALIGGVAGNAGVFSNAHDIGVIFQMLLNNGSYGGRRYLNPGTVKLFTSRQKDHHRGLGFDMKTRKAIIGPSASAKSFGHTGFTGTCVWADPEENLIFVFLSNRIHPSVKNWKLNSLKIRQRIHEAIYQAIKNSKASAEKKEAELEA